MKRLQLFPLLFLVFHSGLSQNISSPESLLDWIAEQQINADAFYDDGLYRTQRIYGKNVYEDNTLFNASLIVLTLNSISDKMSLESQEKIMSIHNGVKQNAFRYLSRKGRPTFNFWQTNPDIPHPGGPEKYQKDKYKLPDDFDDTSLIGLLIDSTEFSLKIRNEMIRYTAERKKKIKTTFNRFKKSEAFGVWYADKWSQELDISVVSNTLYFVYANGYTLNRYDSASIDFIKRAIQEDLHKKHPFVLSPYYSKTSSILYHISRLMEIDDSGLLESVKPKIISDLYEELQNVTLEMHKVILYTSLYRLGEQPTPIINTEKLKVEVEDFRWFSANLMHAVGSGTFVRKALNDSRIVPTFYWKCDAYYWTLYLEYLVLSRDS